MLIIFATIMTLKTPTGSLSPSASTIYLTVFHIVLGVGVGATSTSIPSDCAAIRKRGVMLNYVVPFRRQRLCLTRRLLFPQQRFGGENNTSPGSTSNITVLSASLTASSSLQPCQLDSDPLSLLTSRFIDECK